MKVTGNGEPMAVEIYMERGEPFARLARDARAVTVEGPGGESQEMWEWDELTVPCNVAAAQAEADFDAWWRAAEARNMTDAERIDDVDGRAQAGLLDVQEALAEMYEALIGG